MNPTVLIRAETQEQVTQLQSAMKAAAGVRAIASSAQKFMRMSELDALYLSLPMAENWGSRPGPPHTCEVLRNPGSSELSSFPPYAVTGVILRPGEAFVGPETVSLVVRTAVEAVVAFNGANGNAIRFLGFPHIQRSWPGAEWLALCRRIAIGYAEGLQ